MISNEEYDIISENYKLKLNISTGPTDPTTFGFQKELIINKINNFIKQNGIIGEELIRLNAPVLKLEYLKSFNLDMLFFVLIKFRNYFSVVSNDTITKILIYRDNKCIFINLDNKTIQLKFHEYEEIFDNSNISSYIKIIKYDEDNFKIILSSYFNILLEPINDYLLK